MRTALSLKPASREAIQKGCTCKEELQIDVDCPVHFPLYYMDLAKTLEQHTLKTMQSEKYLQYILIALVAIDILSRLMNCN